MRVSAIALECVFLHVCKRLQALERGSSQKLMPTECAQDEEIGSDQLCEVITERCNAAGTSIESLPSVNIPEIHIGKC